MASDAVKRGLRLSPASWNTIWMRARSALPAKRAPACRRARRRPKPDAARGRIEQPGDQPHQRGLAAARFAHQADRLAAADGEGRRRRRRAAARRRLRDVGEQRLRRVELAARDVEQRDGRHSGFQQRHDVALRRRRGMRQRLARSRRCARSQRLAVAAGRQVGAAQVGQAAGDRGAARRASRLRPASRPAAWPYRDGADGRTAPRVGAASTTWPACMTDDAVAVLGGEREVVGDEDRRHAAIRAPARRSGP